ncbi:MAG: hypothetical protein CL578_02240 [Alteromonadaceae bacterium]|uniref:hypothetical protein n=1 Tax=Paraglaciecola chathamensis TaxID=368405 RepID=UPI000C43D9FC|nr:hypothetical protein [Paraglaciecola agarilytica]MBN23850.1 hypothetical protein [Alteromonadaceae bacterium]
MKRESISIPMSIALTSESSWEKLNEKATSFFVMRFHFQLNEKIIDEPHKVGDWIGLYQSTKGMSAQHVRSETTEVEQVISTHSIEKHFLESEFLSELAVDLVQSFEIPKLLRFKSGVKSKVSDTVKKHLEKSVEILDSNKITKTEKLEITNFYPGEETKAIVSVPVYRKRAVEVILSYIDYLKVDYRRSPLGLRKKSDKSPKITNPKKHSNIHKLGLPIARAYFWELQKNSSKFMYEMEHQTEVKDPSQIKICEPDEIKEKFVEFPNVPSLYQIANAAFPRKWIWRKTPEKLWTEEELKLIELDEVASQGNGWYAKYAFLKK